MLRLQQLASNVHEVTPASTPTASSSPSPTMVRLQHIATNIHETVIDRACWFVPPRRKELAPAAVYNVNLVSFHKANAAFPLEMCEDPLH
ncbi:hypothetical protein MSG28_001276 [Choristoneura fumiferana]|uniref:Uncharacterized protein n=1 Tax=Choristoneura fumiferana TaxID=7141 RepID=A0ACC0K487_CHOFU|nr:hypothetical protein MSG28_001276 [Choristoneura fumiferana]